MAMRRNPPRKRAARAVSGRERKAAVRKPAPRKSKAKYWSARVTEESNALDIEHGAFALDDPRAIAESLKRSAESSTRRKAGPFQSAMSMLNFYINRAGKNLPAARKRTLNQAKVELRKLFGRE
jgi:hypothetical protein